MGQCTSKSGDSSPIQGDAVGDKTKPATVAVSLKSAKPAISAVGIPPLGLSTLFSSMALVSANSKGPSFRTTSNRVSMIANRSSPSVSKARTPATIMAALAACSNPIGMTNSGRVIYGKRPTLLAIVEALPTVTVPQDDSDTTTSSTVVPVRSLLASWSALLKSGVTIAVVVERLHEQMLSQHQRVAVLFHNSMQRVEGVVLFMILFYWYSLYTIGLI